MRSLHEITSFLDGFAPARLAEEWDNVGLLVGDDSVKVERVMTCLTITEETAAEAIEESADLIVTHHPLPFRPLQKLTSATREGRLLLRLIEGRVAVYSPHTAFDSSVDGINQYLAAGLDLDGIAPLVAQDGDDNAEGRGRYGQLAQVTLEQLAEKVKSFLKIDGLRIVGDPGGEVTLVGLACGSGGEFLSAAAESGCDCLITGEARFHTCLEAESAGISLVLVGHFASERCGVEHLANVLAVEFPEATVWASRREKDPLLWR